MAMLVLLALWGLYLFVGQLSGTQMRLANEQRGAAALAGAKEALLADAISRSAIKDAAYLRVPDLGADLVGVGWVAGEGNASPTFPGSGKDRSVVGKFPWKTLGSGPLRDQYGECLWYILAGRFQIAPKTDALNWDSQGQIDVIDSSGNVAASNLVALIVAPGRALDTQSRALANAAYSECGGNYDARNYLDSFASADAIAGQLNYFIGSINNRGAPDANKKSFVMAQTDHYNDRFLFITVDDIFTPLSRRSDFATAIATLLDQPTFQTHLRTITVAGNKGTDNVDCRCNYSPCALVAGDAFQDFCENWKEMLLLTELPAASSITINGAASAICSRVLFFGGRKTATQSRVTSVDKANKDNYLENQNAVSFGVPIASAVNFSGALAFDSGAPARDLVRCLP